jgi:hypothetical protein
VGRKWLAARQTDAIDPERISAKLKLESALSFGDGQQREQ